MTNTKPTFNPKITNPRSERSGWKLRRLEEARERHVKVEQVVCVEVETVRGGRSSLRLEDYVVLEISEINNDRPDIIKGE